MNKIRVGDIIRFRSGMRNYTVLDIDTSRVSFDVPTQLYIQFTEEDETSTIWWGCLESLNEKLNRGHITILNPRISPIKKIKKFTLE